MSSARAYYEDMQGPDLGWSANAECSRRKLAAAEFFPEPGVLVSPEVITACGVCPVRLQCLDYAMQCEATAPHHGGRIYRYGWWGGLSPQQRTAYAEGRGSNQMKIEEWRKQRNTQLRRAAAETELAG